MGMNYFHNQNTRSVLIVRGGLQKFTYLACAQKFTYLACARPWVWWRRSEGDEGAVTQGGSCRRDGIWVPRGRSTDCSCSKLASSTGPHHGFVQPFGPCDGCGPSIHWLPLHPQAKIYSRCFTATSLMPTFSFLPSPRLMPAIAGAYHTVPC